MRRGRACLAIGLMLWPAVARGAASEAVGNTDGLLTWRLGDLAPGATARVTVLLLSDAGYESLAVRLPAVRAWAAGAFTGGRGSPVDDTTVLANGVTDLVLEGPGSFFWEGARQAFTAPAGGQLSRFGYAIGYDDGSPRVAAVSITERGQIDGLRALAPIRRVGDRLEGSVETTDGRLQVAILARLGEGAEAAIHFALTNRGDRPLAALRLSVYANLEAAHTHENDYALLDSRTGGLLTADLAGGGFVLMTGVEAPSDGHAGLWPSETALRQGEGVPAPSWSAYAGLPEDRRRSLAAAAVPHAIALPGEGREPETRTLGPAEAEALLVADWLFQADGRPTWRRVRQELRWARELAARIARHPAAPDLRPELAELDALERRSEEHGDLSAPAPRPPGAIAWWRCEALDDGAVADELGAQAARLVGAGGIGPGVHGDGLALSGGALATGLGLPDAAEYTLCAWIRTVSGEADVIGNGVGVGHVLLMTYRGVVRGHHWTEASGNVIDGTAKVNDGAWHHVAQVVDGESIALYVDGRLDARQPFVGMRRWSPDPLRIGARDDPNAAGAYPARFIGGLDEVSVCGRALSAAELAALWAAGRAAGEPDPRATELYLAVRRVKRRIALRNPVIDFQQVLLVDSPYPQGAEWAHEARHRNGILAVPGGRLLVLEGLHPGAPVRKLAPRDGPASFWRPDLSFDGRRVLFCMKPADEPSFHLYEIGIDGEGLRQLTNSPYDDLDPIYLPDSHILFSTTRANTYVRCMPYTYSYVLARCDADGRNIYIISQGNEPDWLPALLNDGRVAYTRWEYTDKMLWRIQSLWTVHPDGTNVSVLWGNQSVWPDMLVEPRPVPGSHRIMFVGAAHHDWFSGPVGLIDPRAGFNYPDGLTVVTPDVPWPECGPGPADRPERADYHSSGAFVAYKTPFPLSEEDFLVSARAGGVPVYDGPEPFKLYLMDTYGNRELLYQGAGNVWHAVPLRPRVPPPRIPDRVAWPGTGSSHREPEPGVFYSADVCAGAVGLPREKVKYLRVIQMDSRTYSTWTRDVMPHQHQGPTVSILQADGVKRILGEVPIAPDGSVSFQAPPGRALHFQLLDEHRRALQTMRSFVGVMPGERRGCVGCHESHSVAPENRPGQAFAGSPAPLEPPFGTDETFGYERSIHPILERACGACHTGAGAGREHFDLTLREGQGVFKEPYVSLVGGSVYHGPKSAQPPPSIAGCLPVETWPLAGEPAAVQTFPPLTYMSYGSRLVNHYATPAHHDVHVGEEDLRRLAAWVDLVCPYRGEPEIRSLPDPEFVGIEALPIRPRVRTAPRIDRFDLPQDRVAGRDP